MPSTTNYNFGDVVLVAFPFTNLQATKKRPAVIISRKTYQQNSIFKLLIATLEQSQIVKVMGRLSDADREGLGKVIQTIVGES